MLTQDNDARSQLKPSATSELSKPGEIAPERNASLERATLITNASAAVDQSTAALNKSLATAAEINLTRGLGIDQRSAEQVLSAMRQEMATASAAGRDPKFSFLRAKAGELPQEVSAAINYRVEGLSDTLATRSLLSALDTRLNTLSERSLALASELAQLRISGMTNTLADLRNGAINCRYS